MNVPTACRPRRRAAIVLALVAAAVAPAPATANQLPSRTLTLPVRAPSVGNANLGNAQMTVSYTDTDASATVSAPSVMVGPNADFRVISCLRAYSEQRTYSSDCEINSVVTTGQSRAISVPAPTVDASLTRPATGGDAWFTYEVTVQQLRDGYYRPVASSWASDVKGSSVTVPAVGSTTAAAPSSFGEPLSTGGTGGVNGGQPDGFCSSSDLPATGSPGAGVNTTALGSDAPAYYEVGQPTGAYAGRAPKGVMLVIHGGGWASVGAGGVASMRGDADRWRARGWRTLNFTYRACRQSFDDVLWFYDHARQLWGDALPFCALGASAGGHLALELAGARSLDCVVDQAGPTDTTSLQGQSTPSGGTDGPRKLYNMMVSVFGPDDLQWWSPARFPKYLTGTRILYASGSGDPLVPAAQGTTLRDSVQSADPDAYVDVDQLAKGTVSWVHAPVTQAALDEYYAREQRLVAPLG
jgi:acetyl esterase/lipase